MTEEIDINWYGEEAEAAAEAAIEEAERQILEDENRPVRSLKGDADGMTVELELANPVAVLNAVAEALEESGRGDEFRVEEVDIEVERDSRVVIGELDDGD